MSGPIIQPPVNLKQDDIDRLYRPATLGTDLVQQVLVGMIPGEKDSIVRMYEDPDGKVDVSRREPKFSPSQPRLPLPERALIQSRIAEAKEKPTFADHLSEELDRSFQAISPPELKEILLKQLREEKLGTLSDLGNGVVINSDLRKQIASELGISRGFDLSELTSALASGAVLSKSTQSDMQNFITLHSFIQGMKTGLAFHALLEQLGSPTASAPTLAERASEKSDADQKALLGKLYSKLLEGIGTDKKIQENTSPFEETRQVAVETFSELLQGKLPKDYACLLSQLLVLTTSLQAGIALTGPLGETFDAPINPLSSKEAQILVDYRATHLGAQLTTVMALTAPLIDLLTSAVARSAGGEESATSASMLANSAVMMAALSMCEKANLGANSLSSLVLAHLSRLGDAFANSSKEVLKGDSLTSTQESIASKAQEVTYQLANATGTLETTGLTDTASALAEALAQNEGAVEKWKSFGPSLHQFFNEQIVNAGQSSSLPQRPILG
ncbi:MAG: hypothetical protein KDK40_05485 [Chlamydiia bacterium]|nr:hypothetical protein [Chlamydiia bacterium]